MMAVLVLWNCPILAGSVLTVHPKSTHGFPLPDGPAYLRCVASVYDPRWPMLSVSSSPRLLYMFALRS